LIEISARIVEQEAEGFLGSEMVYMEQGTADLKTKMLEIKIRDHGIGLKDLGIIGKMFTQLDVKDNVNQNGIGFGLTISKMLVEQMGGNINFRNHTKHQSGI
jgi:signal transduction histidine kinase